jgi:hypothetical protein
MATVEEGVQMYVDTINRALTADSLTRGMLTWRKRSKYYKIEREGGGAHAFVEIETGDIFKPASSKAPAKGIRGNVTDPEYIQYVAAYRRPYDGGHLYAKQSSVVSLGATVTDTIIISYAL